MNVSSEIAQSIKALHFGSNWTESSLKETLSDVNWKEATTRVHALNTIAALVFHINYFIDAQLNVLKGNPLNAHDKYSFDVPPINTPKEWELLLIKTWSDAEAIVQLIELLPDAKLQDYFTDEKYDTYYKNFQGVIEHGYYHLGQIVLIKKILHETEKHNV